MSQFIGLLKRFSWKITFWLMLPWILLACDDVSLTYEESARQRLAKAERGQGDIVIGVVWDHDASAPAHLVEGTRLAAQEINASGGLLGGRKVHLVIKDEQENAPYALASNLDVVAVIGHRYAESAMPASVTYSYHNMLFLAPFTADIKLTQHGFENVFRTLPNHERQAKALATFCKKEAEFHKMVILHSRDSSSEELGGMFYEAAVAEEINVMQYSSFYHLTQDFRRLIAKFKNKNFDAIFIAANYESAGRLMRQVREMGISVPFVGSDALDTPGLLKVADKAAEGTIVPTVYDPTTKEGQIFMENFSFAFPNLEVDQAAAQGYDTLKLLAFAIQQSQTTIPIVVGNTIRYMPRWLGVTGQHLFDENGEILSKQFVFKELRNGHFEYITTKAFHAARKP